MWIKAVIFCLAVGGGWACLSELVLAQRLRAQEIIQPFRPVRVVYRGLAAGGACLAGLWLLTQFGLTTLSGP